MQITIPDLNFDYTLDEDWFKVIALPPYTVGETPGCQPILEIWFAEGMRLELYGSDERLILRDSSSPATITADFLAPLPIAFKLVPAVPGRALDYTLELRFRQTDAELCEWAESHADGRHLGRMRGSGLIGFPAYFADVPSFGPGEYPPLKERIADTLQRVINPDVYMINWRQSGVFTATIELLQGTSIRVRLMSSQGQVMAEAATDDLLGNIGAQALLSPHAMISDNPKPVSPRQILFLVNSQLAAGNYLLEVSLGRPNTVLLVTLPRGATSDGSLGVEDYTAGPQPDPPAIKMGRTPNGLMIAWPDKGFRFLLEEKLGLGLNASWQPSQKKPVVIDGQNSVGLSPTDPQSFFRLRYAP
jgi:hypothetical protein